MRSLPPRFRQTRVATVPFDYGYVDSTPNYRIPAGACRAAQNYECGVIGGYSQIDGYERFDGQPSPSDGIYALLNVTITGSYALGDTLTGAVSGATGVIIAATSAYFALTKVTGTFQAEAVQIAAVTIATASGAQLPNAAATAKLSAQYKNLAADEYRADIAAVPGSGSVLGVVRLADVIYAFRNNAGGTAAAMYKSTTSGWSLVALGRELAFTSGGTYVPAEGDVLTGETSGATATLTRIALESGTYAAGTAAGKFIFASQTGTFQAETVKVGANLNIANIAGNSSAITFAVPSGRFEFVLSNFGGGANTKRIYGCDGKNRGFEFDGTVFVPVTTGMASDVPVHVGAHKNHSFFSFAGSAQHSGIGTPYQWTVISGAAELAQGDTLTAFMSQTGGTGTASTVGTGALAIFTRNRINILYGSSSADWNLVNFAEEQGALAWSVQKFFTTMMLDDRGVVSMESAAQFGNFQYASLSNHIKKFINEKLSKIKASCVVRAKNQYRLFFTDSYALYVTMDGNKLRGLMPVLYADAVTCAWSSEAVDGTEEMFFGSTDGVVYQMDRGTSFDGDAIERYLHLAYNGDRQEKTYTHCGLEVAGDGYSEFNFSYSLGYGSADLQQPNNTTVTTSFAATLWDAFTWDAFIWDGQTLFPSEVNMEGTAENVSLLIESNSDYFAPITFSGAFINYLPGKLIG